MVNNYAAVNGRCLFDLRWCRGNIAHCPQIDRELMKRILLEQYGIEPVDIDIVELARGLVQSGRYELGARPGSAPEVVDCSSFTQYLFRMMGIPIPRASVDQEQAGDCVAWYDCAQWRAGDLVFATGPQNYFRTDKDTGIGHVGLYTGDLTVVHACPGKKAVTEVEVGKFFSGTRQIRGVTRILPPREYQQVFALNGQEVYWSKTLLRLVQRALD